MFITATLTSKGQITLPKEVRQYLHLATGDIVIFRINDKQNTVTLEKAKSNCLCQVCGGNGNISGLSCPVCGGQGKISRDISVWDELGLLITQGFRQGIEVQIYENAGSPSVRLKSPSYPREALAQIEDYFNAKFKEVSNL